MRTKPTKEDVKLSNPNVFEYLSQQLQALPQQLQDIYEDKTIETVDTYFYNFAGDLRDTSGSESLNAKMTVYPPAYKKGKFYVRRLDWDDKTIVNIDQGKSYGAQKKRKRESNKRNYSAYPATYHDLAYIINYGHGGKAGTYFIKKARHKLNHWEKKRDDEFRRALYKIKTK